MQVPMGEKGGTERREGAGVGSESWEAGELRGHERRVSVRSLQG